MEAGNEAGAVGYQEEKGTVPLWPEEARAVVLAEDWPSWSFALDGLGCKNILTYVQFRGPKAREEFKVTALGKTRVGWDLLRRDWRNRKDSPCVFVQGGKVFRERMRAMTKELGASRVVEVGDKACWDSDKWAWQQEVSHRQVGGVTTGRWMVGASKGPGRRLHFSKIRRVLQHIIKLTNPGKLLRESPFSIARA